MGERNGCNNKMEKRNAPDSLNPLIGDHCTTPDYRPIDALLIYQSLSSVQSGG